MDSKEYYDRIFRYESRDPVGWGVFSFPHNKAPLPPNTWQVRSYHNDLGTLFPAHRSEILKGWANKTPKIMAIHNLLTRVQLEHGIEVRGWPPFEEQGNG